MGFYIRPEMHHFRHYYWYIPTRIGERVSNKVELFHVHLNMPYTSSEDRLTQVTQDFLTVLESPQQITPLLYQRDKTSDASNKTQSIFQPPQQYDTRKISSPPRVSVTAKQAPRVLQSDVATRKSSSVP